MGPVIIVAIVEGLIRAGGEARGLADQHPDQTHLAAAWVGSAWSQRAASHPGCIPLRGRGEGCSQLQPSEPNIPDNPQPAPCVALMGSAAQRGT